MLDKDSRQFRLSTHCQHHRLLLDMEEYTVCHDSRRRHAYNLASETTFSKEIAFAQNAKRCFFAAFRNNAEAYLPGLNEEQSVSRIALSEDRILLRKGHHVPALPNR